MNNEQVQQVSIGKDTFYISDVSVAKLLNQGTLQVVSVDGQQMVIEPFINNQSRIVAHVRNINGQAHIIPYVHQQQQEYQEQEEQNSDIDDNDNDDVDDADDSSLNDVIIGAEDDCMYHFGEDVVLDFLVSETDRPEIIEIPLRKNNKKFD